ncbi:hypothetical protein [Celeribacter halophilus]|uniref:hypothetical protein n=1 Tax=Celeribacter halophilus TaxID=576117 RepID=UPI003A92B8C6
MLIDVGHHALINRIGVKIYGGKVQADFVEHTRLIHAGKCVGEIELLEDNTSIF